MLETLKEFFKQYGSIGLFLNAFFDGFCLPLPPDFLLSTLVIQQIGNPTRQSLFRKLAGTEIVGRADDNDGQTPFGKF